MTKLLCAIAVALVASAHFADAKGESQKPPIMTPAQWKAKPANTDNMVEQPKVDGVVVYKGIVVHHTQIAQTLKGWATKSIEQKMRDIQRDHQTRVIKFAPGKTGTTWGDFAYHYFIDVDGRISQGRDIGYIGDSDTPYDPTGLFLVVLQGDFNHDRPTKRQLASLDSLVAWLAAKYGVDPVQITGHNDHLNPATKKPVATDCPGAYLKAYLPELRRKTAAALKLH
jgi:hypothetical protein